jgi:hypothetical protein
VTVVAEVSATETDAPAEKRNAQDAGNKAMLKEKALADTAVQTMLEVFPAEIRDVEEM